MTQDESGADWSADFDSVDTQPIDMSEIDFPSVQVAPSRPLIPSLAGIIGIDGHEGTGKTTIARGVARALNASYQRPFGGERGLLLARADEAGDVDAVLRIGSAALTSAIWRSGPTRPVVLDRSWMTVGSLMTDEDFYDEWQVWVPTILCWADLPTTMARLDRRDEPAKSLAWHQHYIDRYRRMAEDRGCVIVDTSQHSDTEAIGEAVRAAERLLKWSAPELRQPRSTQL